MSIVGGCKYCGSVGHTAAQHIAMLESANETAAVADENGEKHVEPVDVAALDEAADRAANMIEMDFGPAGRMLVPKEEFAAERGFLPNQPGQVVTFPVSTQPAVMQDYVHKKPEDYWPEGTYVFCFKCGTKVPIPIEVFDVKFQANFILVQVNPGYEIPHTCGGK